jgi:uncharacterized protein
MLLIFALLSFWQQTGIFISTADHLVYLSLLAAVLLICLLWLADICIAAFSIPLGLLYKPLKWLLFFLYYSLGRIITFFIRKSKEVYRESFLEFQNRLFLVNAASFKSDRLLILLPHCLQHHDCRVRITRDIEDCEDCARCDIAALKGLGHKYGVKIGIANGGTLARKLIRDHKPDAIIAVACHRDLSDGVRESWKYPVYAILNERPNGPCFDTKASTHAIEKIIKKISI